MGRQRIYQDANNNKDSPDRRSLSLLQQSQPKKPAPQRSQSAPPPGAGNDPFIILASIPATPLGKGGGKRRAPTPPIDVTAMETDDVDEAPSSKRVATSTITPPPAPAPVQAAGAMSSKSPKSPKGSKGSKGKQQQKPIQH